MNALQRYHDLRGDWTAYGVVGSEGGVQVWWQPVPHVAALDGRDVFGGVEYHYRTPPSYRIGSEPDNTECFLLQAPCWHDGSSLQFTERYESLRHNPKAIYRALESDYRRAFTDTEAQQAHQVVYAVLCHEGVGMDIDSVWRTEQEAEAEVDRLRRLFPPYTFSVQANALQGAR